MDFDRTVHICHANSIILYSSLIYSTEKRYNFNMATSSARVWPCIAFCVQCCTRDILCALTMTFTPLHLWEIDIVFLVGLYDYSWNELFMTWILITLGSSITHNAMVKHRICSPLYSITTDIHLKVKRFMWLSHWTNERVQSYDITSFCGLSRKHETFTHLITTNR